MHAISPQLNSTQPLYVVCLELMLERIVFFFSPSILTIVSLFENIYLKKRSFPINKYYIYSVVLQYCECSRGENYRSKYINYILFISYKNCGQFHEIKTELVLLCVLNEF